MATKTQAQKPSANLYGPTNQPAGKPFVYKFPTPSLTDRILSVRVDSRAGSFSIPNQGDPYDGPDAAQFAGFMFATAAPIEGNPGWWNLFYLDQRANQDAYNYTIEYPYTDRDYPRLTRTYVYLRGTVSEPTAGEQDPVYNDNPNSSEDLKALGNLNLLLTEHKLVRFENEPIVDALFIGVTRIYERLPGPVIRSYDENPYQQIVTIDTQEVQSGTTPVADAWTDILKVERTTTAKQKNTVGKVPDVPAKNIFTQLWSSPYRDFLPIAFRYKNPLITQEHDEAGIASAADAVLGPIDTTKTAAQITEFRRHISTTSAPIKSTIFVEQKLSPEQQIITVTKDLEPGNQIINNDVNAFGPLLISDSVEQVGLGATIRTTETVDSVFPKQVEISEIPNVIPLKFRATIPTIIEAETVPGIVPIGMPPALDVGQLKVSQTQETEFKMRLETERIDPTPLPATLVDQELLEDLPRSEGMSGVLSVTDILSANPLTIDQGFFVTSSEVRNVGAGLQLKTTKQIDQWPTLIETHTDPETGIVIDITKTMVPAGTQYPGPPFPNTGGPYVDIIPLDKWRSIQIVSAVDLGSVPFTYSWGTLHNYEIPSVLWYIASWWNSSTKSQFQSATGTGKGATASAGAVSYASARGLITYAATAGRVVPCPAEVVRTYRFGPPPFSSLKPIFNFLTVDGSAVIAGTSFLTGETDGSGGGTGPDGNPGVLGQTNDVEFIVGDRIDIRNVLTGSYRTYGDTNVVVLPTITADAGPDANGDFFSVTEGGGAFVTARMIVTLPQSTPNIYPAGQRQLVDVKVQRWRFGVFIVDETYITFPPLPPSPPAPF